MKNYRLIIIWISMFFMIIAYNKIMKGQSNNRVYGKIIDSRSGQPLHYANINVQGKNIGCVSNMDGMFVLNTQKTDLSDTVVVSYIGYKSYSIPLHEFSDSINLFKLVSDPVQLAEFKVRAMDAKEIVEAAIKKIPENYEMDPFTTLGFYRELIREGETYHKGALGVQ
ncbi:MAG: carboxypeptidase-like regulatory domain-containing protein [Bacteroidetes bacterium]|nr:carboxypeptidase-like regulatory domain-containing protein [Bacteroidota bacterium]